MRGVFHRAAGIEAFLRGNPVRWPYGCKDNSRFKGKGAKVFYDLLIDKPGAPPTCSEYQERYMADQDEQTRANEACWGRMVIQYMGFMRDYHAGSMLVENPNISSVWSNYVLDADWGIDYIVCSRGRYAAIHVGPGRGDPNGWAAVKERRKSGVAEPFPCHFDLNADPTCKVGGVYLVTAKAVCELQGRVAENGLLRPDLYGAWERMGSRKIEPQYAREEMFV